jgi:hypothetical protein
MKVKIIKPGIIKPGDFPSWYDNHLGEIFNVIDEGDKHYYRVVGVSPNDDNVGQSGYILRRNKNMAIRVYWIEKSDCQVVPEPKIKLKNRYQILRERNVF